MTRNGTLSPWRRARSMSPFASEFDRFFNQAFGAPVALEEGEEAFSPAVDIHETDEHIVLTADMPGMKKDDLKVEVHDGVLTLSGERSQEEEKKENGVLRIERRYGKFTRSFRLPKDVDADNVKANYTDGVLEVLVAKAEAKKPRTIKVS